MDTLLYSPRNPINYYRSIESKVFIVFTMTETTRDPTTRLLRILKRHFLRFFNRLFFTSSFSPEEMTKKTIPASINGNKQFPKYRRAEDQQYSLSHLAYSYFF